MSYCVVYNKQISNQEDKIACTSCSILCHRQCVNLSKEFIEFILKDKQVYRCPPCSKVRRDRMRAAFSAASELPSIADVILLLKEAKED